MILTEVNEKLTRLTGANTTRYTNSQRATDLTIALDQVVTSILDSQDDSDYDDPNHGSFPILRTPTVANQRDYTFAIADGVTQYKEVEITYDGTNWVKCTRLDRSLQPFPTGNDTLLDQQYSVAGPVYDIEGSSVLIYPAPTTSAGYVQVRVSRDVTPITAAELVTGTKVIGIDRAFHYLVVLLAAEQWYMEQNIAGNKLQRLMGKIEKEDMKLRRQYSRKQIDGDIRFDSPYSLDDYGDFNYQT